MVRGVLLEQQLHNLRLAVSCRIVERCVLIVVNRIQVGLGLQQSVHTGHFAIPAGKVQGSPALFVLLILVRPIFKELLEGRSITCARLRTQGPCDGKRDPDIFGVRCICILETQAADTHILSSEAPGIGKV